MTEEKAKQKISLEEIDEREVSRSYFDESLKSIKEVVVETKFVFDGKEFVGTGVAKTHPEDADMSTLITGYQIAKGRAQISTINTIIDALALNKDEADQLLSISKEIESELEDYIALKEDFFSRVRKWRTDPDYNKVKLIKNK